MEIEAIEFRTSRKDGKVYTAALLRVMPSSLRSAGSRAMMFGAEGEDTPELREKLRDGLADYLATEIRAGRLG